MHSQVGGQSETIESPDAACPGASAQRWVEVHFLTWVLLSMLLSQLLVMLNSTMFGNVIYGGVNLSPGCVPHVDSQSSTVMSVYQDIVLTW